MERLTSYKSGCKREMICRHEDCDTCEEYCPHLNEDNCTCLQEVLEKLAEYEGLEEQGKLLKLPCAVGDTVYVKLASYCNSKYAEAEVRDFIHFISCGFCVVVTSEKFDKCNIPFSEFGKTVFLTREEAEATLKGLKKDEID